MRYLLFIASVWLTTVFGVDAATTVFQGNVTVASNVTAQAFYGSMDSTNLTGIIPLARLGGATNAIENTNGTGYSTTLFDPVLRDTTGTRSLLFTNFDAVMGYSNGYGAPNSLWWSPPSDDFFRVQYQQADGAGYQELFWPHHTYNTHNGQWNPEMVFTMVNTDGSIRGSLCYYYDWIQWGPPYLGSGRQNFWYFEPMTTICGPTETNNLDGVLWQFHAVTWTNAPGATPGMVAAGSLDPNFLMVPSIRFKPVGTNGSAAWIFYDKFPEAKPWELLGTYPNEYRSEVGSVRRFQITVGPDAGLELVGTMKATAFESATGTFTNSVINYGTGWVGTTNSTAPGDTNTIKGWVNYTNTTGGVFKMPLYQ